MSFVVLPRAAEVSDRLRAAWAERLCPYDGAPELRLETAACQVWGTRLTTRRGGAVVPTLDQGTARFEVRAEGDGVAISTDPLGTCPVWYAATDAGAVASTEAKALAPLVDLCLRATDELLAPGPRPVDWSPFANARRLPPGAALVMDAREARVLGAAPAFDVAREDDEPERDWEGELAAALDRLPVRSAAPTGCFVSGGIDSSIACALAAREGPVPTFSLRTHYGDELSEARPLAEELGCTLDVVDLPAERIRDELARVVFQNEVFDGLTAEILLQLSVLFDAAAPLCERVATGYGSDLLFEGMLRHAAYMAAVGLRTTAELLERTRWTGELAPFVAWSRDLALAHVYWEPSWIHLALRVPNARCYAGDGVEKRVLRESAVRAGLLSRACAFREKRGLTDGTQAHRLVAEELGIPEPYDYTAKSHECVRLLRRALA